MSKQITIATMERRSERGNHVKDRETMFKKVKYKGNKKRGSLWPETVGNGERRLVARFTTDCSTSEGEEEESVNAV
jgi:hypothetical protein